MRRLRQRLFIYHLFREIYIFANIFFRCTENYKLLLGFSFLKTLMQRIQGRTSPICQHYYLKQKRYQRPKQGEDHVSHTPTNTRFYEWNFFHCQLKYSFKISVHKVSQIYITIGTWTTRYSLLARLLYKSNGYKDPLSQKYDDDQYNEEEHGWYNTYNKYIKDLDNGACQHIIIYKQTDKTLIGCIGNSIMRIIIACIVTSQWHMHAVLTKYQPGDRQISVIIQICSEFNISRKVMFNFIFHIDISIESIVGCCQTKNFCKYNKFKLKQIYFMFKTSYKQPISMAKQ